MDGRLDLLLRHGTDADKDRALEQLRARGFELSAGCNWVVPHDFTVTMTDARAVMFLHLAWGHGSDVTHRPQERLH